MAPFPCLLDGVSVLILDKGNSRSYKRIGVTIKIPGSLFTDTPFKSTRNANGLQYQFATPRMNNGQRQRLDAGQIISVYLTQPDHPLIKLNLTLA